VKQQKAPRDTEGLIFDLDTFAIHDGPGIRMAVYLKGCQLACKWCHSPESIRPEPELIFMRDRCLLCGACAEVCAQGVHSIADGKHALAREKCLACGRCVEACATGALAIKGYRVSAAEIVERAARMKPFFDHSGGGITLTGGEVTRQVDFAETVLRGCREQGIHTAIETNGASPWERLQRLLPHSDLVLYDLKLIDDAQHRRWTGASNRLVLDNAARLKGRNVQVRVPLIPGITDTDENLRGIFSFMRSAGLSSVGLLPFNPSTAAKYEWLCLPCEVEGEPQSPQRLQHMLDLASEVGLEAAVD
jgi:pyruvate formate lyase activating enzyme